MKWRLIIAILMLTAVSIWIYGRESARINPYKDKGLQIEWQYHGATSTYPTLVVWSEYQGERIEPDLDFSGLPNPWLRFIDYDGDGRRDIIYRNKHHMQVVAYFPAAEGTPPRFEILRNDVTWP